MDLKNENIKSDMGKFRTAAATLQIELETCSCLHCVVVRFEVFPAILDVYQEELLLLFLIILDLQHTSTQIQILNIWFEGQ